MLHNTMPVSERDIGESLVPDEALMLVATGLGNHVFQNKIGVAIFMGSIWWASKFIHQATTSRSTTKADDEPIIMALALGQKTDLILKHKGERRFIAFFQTLKEFPAAWLFLGVPPVSVPGYSWVPRSLPQRIPFGQAPALPMPEDAPFYVTDRGLVGELPVIISPEVQASLRGHGTISVPVSEAGGDTSYYLLDNCVTQERHAKRPYEETMWYDKADFNVLILQDSGKPDESGFALVAKTNDDTSDVHMQDRKNELTCSIRGIVRMLDTCSKPLHASFQVSECQLWNKMRVALV